MASYSYSNGITTLNCDGYGWASAILPTGGAPAGTQRMRFAYRAYFNDLLSAYGTSGQSMEEPWLMGSHFGLSFEQRSPALQNAPSVAGPTPEEFKNFVGWANRFRATIDSGTTYDRYVVGYTSGLIAGAGTPEFTFLGGSWFFPGGGSGSKIETDFYAGAEGVIPSGTWNDLSFLKAGTPYVSGYMLDRDLSSWPTSSGPPLCVPESIKTLPRTPGFGEMVTQGWEISGNDMDKGVSLKYYLSTGSLVNLLDVFDTPTYQHCNGKLFSNETAYNPFTKDGVNFNWPSHIVMRMAHPGKMILEKYAFEYEDSQIV